MRSRPGAQALAGAAGGQALLGDGDRLGGEVDPHAVEPALSQSLEEVPRPAAHVEHCATRARQPVDGLEDERHTALQVPALVLDGAQPGGEPVVVRADAREAVAHPGRASADWPEARRTNCAYEGFRVPFALRS